MTSSAPSTSSLLPTYARYPLGFARGDGVWLESTDGTRYLDLGGGIAVASLGYSHPHLVQALTDQAQKLWHTSNLFQIPQAETLAARLCAMSFADYVFFTNSGAEALEGAIKTARKYHAVSGHPDRYHIITFEGAFHGRTLATIAAGGNEKYIEGFGPKAPGFDSVAWGDIEAVKAAVGPQTAAILVEPIQGEGGIRVPPRSFLRALREICDAHGLLLVVDEVQSGVGRTGKFFAYEHTGITPDIMAIAKGIGGGFPLGAFLTTKDAGKGMTFGTHGTTYGGNPLATAVGNAVLDVVLGEGFIDAVAAKGLRLKQKLAALKDRHGDVVADVRGEGLMIGLQLHVPPADFAAAGREEHVLVIPAADNVVRLLPPLVISEEEIGEAVERLEATCRRISASLLASSLQKGAAGMTRALPADSDIRHFLDLSEVPATELRRIMDHAAALKSAWRKGVPARDKPLAGRALAMIFDKPSTRTRVSFDLAMRQLGGDTIMLTGKEMQLGRGETIADTARVLSRFVDAIAIRMLDHSAMTELAENAQVPVINALTKRSHPCQIMADVLTYEEHRGPIKGSTVAWCGDGNNVLASWVHAAQRFGFTIKIATPVSLSPPTHVLEWARAASTNIVLTNDPFEAVDGADCVVTDCWLSMGDEDKTARYNLLKPYQVNTKLMAAAAKDALFMHCLPAHRGEEVTDEIIDGPQSVVFAEAENRLHAQKGILAWCLGAMD